MLHTFAKEAMRFEVTYWRVIHVFTIILCACGSDGSISQCSYDGGSEQIGMSLHPSNGAGIYLFSDPVDCNSSLAASGFCIFAGITKSVELRLDVYDWKNTEWLEESYSIIVACNSTLFSGSNSNIQDPSANVLAIRFDSTCNKPRCLFKPAIFNDTSKRRLNDLDSRTNSNISLIYLTAIKELEAKELIPPAVVFSEPKETEEIITPTVTFSETEEIITPTVTFSELKETEEIITPTVTSSELKETEEIITPTVTFSELKETEEIITPTVTFSELKETTKDMRVIIISAVVFFVIFLLSFSIIALTVVVVVIKRKKGWRRQMKQIPLQCNTSNSTSSPSTILRERKRSETNSYSAIGSPESNKEFSWEDNRKTRELGSSFTYDYVQDGERGFRALSMLSEGHYEFDEEMLRESAGVEDEVKTQELKSSFTYDYAQHGKRRFRALSTLSEGHYEFDSSSEEMLRRSASVDELNIRKLKSDDYAKDRFRALSMLSEGHYEFDSSNEERLRSVDKLNIRKLRSSITYEDEGLGFGTMSTFSEGHYEFDITNKMFWEPASMEDELKIQLQYITLSEENLMLLNEVGSGAFGVVRRGIWSVGGEEREVAVKSLADGSTEEKRIQFLQEAAVMCQFKHPNVITLHGVVMEHEPMMIVLEIMHIGNLSKYLLSLKPTNNVAELPHHTPGLFLSFCRQISSGMNYLSSKDFVHRDLAARNILVSRDEMCKIADFGMSRALQDTDYYVSRGGKIPVKWTAPEALHYNKFSTASDVWSFGVVLYEIWALGIKPYHNMSNAEVFKRIDQSSYRLPPPPGCPRRVYRIMMDCWNPVPKSRPSFGAMFLELQRPDFKLLTWTAEDVAAYTEQARTLGAPLEAGEELYTELQCMYHH